MIGLGAIISLAGQAASGIMSAVNNRKMQSAADSEAARQVAYNEARAYQDPLARSENQAALRQYDRDSQAQVETAQNIATITGATPEYSLGVQKGISEGRADLMRGVTKNASKDRDTYLDKAETVKHDKFKDDQTRKAERNTTYANLAANAASAFGSILDSYTAKPGTGNPTTDQISAYKASEAAATPGKARTSMAATISSAKSNLGNPFADSGLGKWKPTGAMPLTNINGLK